MDKQQVPLHSLGNRSQYPVINHNEKEYERQYKSVCNWITSLYSVEINTTL